MLITILVILLVLVALLAAPVTLTYQVSWQQAYQGKMTLYWLFGLVRIQFPIAETEKTAEERKTAIRKKRVKKSSAIKSNPIAAIRQKNFRQRIFRFIRDLWQAIHKQNLSFRVRIGLGDPADTGQLWAIIGPLSGMLACVQEASIEIKPEFVDTVFELDSSGNIRFIPLQMIYLVIGLLLSPSIWKGIQQMRNDG
jgi:hypothetical protein